jgi:hypothetical protein
MRRSPLGAHRDDARRARELHDSSRPRAARHDAVLVTLLGSQAFDGMFPSVEPFPAETRSKRPRSKLVSRHQRADVALGAEESIQRHRPVGASMWSPAVTCVREVVAPVRIERS